MQGSVDRSEQKECVAVVCRCVAPSRREIPEALRKNVDSVRLKLRLRRFSDSPRAFHRPLLSLSYAKAIFVVKIYTEFATPSAAASLPVSTAFGTIQAQWRSTCGSSASLDQSTEEV